jgi:hypothetical protein
MEMYTDNILQDRRLLPSAVYMLQKLSLSPAIHNILLLHIPYLYAKYLANIWQPTFDSQPQHVALPSMYSFLKFDYTSCFKCRYAQYISTILV